MKQETEDLLQKWLKLEIAKAKWGIVFRIVTIVLLVVGIVMGAQVVEPIVARQLQLLDAIQTNFVKSSGIQIQDQQSLLDVFHSLTPQQREQMQQMLQENQ